MTVTAAPPVSDRLDDAEYEAALERLREFRRQLDQAEQYADTGSLARAADLAMLFNDPEKRWVKEWDKEHPVKRAQFRGRPVEREGRSRFSSFIKARTDLHPSRAYRLLNAEDLRRIVSPVAKEISESTEGALRPLSKLFKEHRPEEAIEIWRRAMRIADAKGMPMPTSVEVKEALRAHDKETGRTPADRTAAYYQRTVKEALDRAVREAKWIRQYGAEEDKKRLLLAIHDVFTSTSESNE
jgi:hypothetical protein